MARLGSGRDRRASNSFPTGFALRWTFAASKGLPACGSWSSISMIRSAPACAAGTLALQQVSFTYPGTERPALQVQYVDQPLVDGSGDVVTVRGDAYLEVLVSSVGIPPANAPRPGSASAASLAGTVVAEALPVYGGF